MLIIPYVAAEFRDRNGSVIHRLTAEDRGTLHEAPDAIRQDLLFGLLVADGSIKVAENEGQKKTLERDPMAGVTADGRSAVFASGEYQGALGSEAPGERASGSFSAEDGRQPRAIIRNKRTVRGTVAPIEDAERSAVLKEEKPARSGKPTRTEEKAAEPEKK